MQLAEKTEEKSEDVEFPLRRFYNKRNGKKGIQFLRNQWKLNKNGRK